MARIHYWIGLDVGEKVTACCIVDDQGRVVEQQSVPTQAAEIRALLKPVRSRTRLIAIEAGSAGTHLARSLIRHGYPVAQFDPRQARKFLSIAQNKTDRNDARGLAEIGRLGKNVVSKVLLKTIETQNLRSTLSTRQKMIQLRVALEGMMRSLFQLNGGHLKSASSSHTLHRNVTRELSRLRKTEKVDLREEIEPILKLSQSVRIYVETLDERLKAIAADNSVCQRFMKVPGIGPICALSFYSSVEEPFRFHRNADVGAYLGLTPRSSPGQVHRDFGSREREVE